jgi:multicomponent K+:H+ antiporter subunit D
MTAPVHLVILPILLPLLAGAALLLIDDRRRNLKAALAFVSLLSLLLVAGMLVNTAAGRPGVLTYRVGNWGMPFGIVLVLDRLSGLMVLLTALLALAAHTFAIARWHRASPHFHSIFLFLLVGLNGVFLTGDLFNLFVFLEVLLAASYGLVLHASGPLRVRAGLHYIAINVAGAALLLVGISLLYGVTGTLNMADLAVRVQGLTGVDRGLALSGAAILGIALLLKAGMWPLGFWLVPAYSAAAAPVGAVFAIMTKVGVYTILRLWLPMFGGQSQAWLPLGGNWLLLGGVATVVFGIIGVLSAQRLAPLASYSLLVSSGTLLAVIGTGYGSAIGGALFYLLSSTLAVAALFLLIELVERGRDPGADLLGVTREALGEEEDEELDEAEIGIVIPGSIAFLGLSFIACALLVAGLPPLSGFLGKVAILHGLLNTGGLQSADGISTSAWIILALLLTSGLATVIAASRVGMRALWVEFDREVPRVALLEVLPVLLLLLTCAGMTIGAGPVMKYLDITAESLRSPAGYIEGVLGNPAQLPDATSR